MSCSSLLVNSDVAPNGDAADISLGFGWYADNVWLQAVSILQPALAREFVPSPYVRHSTTALYAGLIVGAFFFGTSCDVVGSVAIFIEFSLRKSG
jgi:hypothetical protein